MIGAKRLLDIREQLEAAVAGVELPRSSAGNTDVADALTRFLSGQPTVADAPAVPAEAKTPAVQPT